MLTLRSLLETGKLIAASMAGMTALGTAYTAIVTFSGGRVIPWVTPSETQEMINSSFKALQMDINTKMDTVIRYQDQQICSDYKERLSRARMALARNPRDMVALDLENASLQKIATIPDCRL